MSVPQRVRSVIEPVIASLDLELFDLEQAGPVLRVTVDRPGGVDIDAIASATRVLSRALDEHDPINGHYTLEVSSPGLERVLRTPAHYAWAVGRDVAIKTVPGFEAGRRFTGRVLAADDTSVTVAVDEPVGDRLTFAFDEIERARTVFEWGPAPKPGGPRRSTPRQVPSAASTSPDPGTPQEKFQP